MEHEIIISNTSDLFRVSAVDVMAFMARGNYTCAVLNNGEESILSFQLGQVAAILDQQLGQDGHLFIRVGRSIIINREYLYTINLPRQELELRSPQGHKVKVGRESVSKAALTQLKLVFELKLREQTGGTS